MHLLLPQFKTKQVMLDPALTYTHTVVSCQCRMKMLLSVSCGCALGKLCLMHLNEKAKRNIYSIVDISTVAAWKEREKLVPTESYHKKQSNMYFSILVSLFKGHTSIPWIQISMEKAYQSNFAQPSSQPNRTETDHVKGYFTPLPMTYERGEEPQHSSPCVGNTLKGCQVT